MRVLLYLLGCLSTHASHISPLLTRTRIYGLGSTRAHVSPRIYIIPSILWHQKLQIETRYGPYERSSKSQGRVYPCVKTQTFKWVVDDLCEPIKKLFKLVGKEGFLASWTINIIQMVFKYGERHSPRSYMTIMLGTIFGNLYGFVLEI
jgi:hypothetical protein